MMAGIVSPLAVVVTAFIAAVMPATRMPLPLANCHFERAQFTHPQDVDLRFLSDDLPCQHAGQFIMVVDGCAANSHDNISDQQVALRGGTLSSSI